MQTLKFFIFVIGTLALGGMANAGYLSTCDVGQVAESCKCPGIGNQRL